MAENFSGPYSRQIEYLDAIADILLGPDDLVHNVGDRRTFALQRLMEFFVQEGSGKYRNVQSDWNADPDSDAAILNKPDGIPVDPGYVHTDENFTTEHRNKLENIEHFAQHNVQSDWTEEDTESDAYIKNVPDDIVQDGSYVHTDFNFNEHYKNMLDYHVITDDYYTPEDSEKLAGIEWNATHTDIDDEITPDSTNPVESGVIYNWMETKVDKEDGYALSKNDFTDELKAKLDSINPNLDDFLSNESPNPVENRVIKDALDQKVDKVEGQGLSDQNFTLTEKVKLEGIEEQANRTIPDENITANSHNVVESRAIYEALDTKVNKINGKGLSENDFTDAYKNKLDNIDDFADNTIVDAQVTESSMNPVTSNAIYTELEKKVDKEEGKSLFTDEERIKLGKFDPDAPKVTIVDLVMNGSTGRYDMLSMTWQQCKDAISNGILYCKDTLGDIQSVSFCYSVETEDRDGETVYRVEFASFNNEYYSFFEAEAPNKHPAFAGSENVKPDLSGKVDKTTKVNGHALDQDVSITPNDIDHSFSRAYDNGTVGASLRWLRDYKADKGTLINGHSLDEDIVITPSDIAFDSEEEYLEGSVGGQLSELINHDEALDETTARLGQSKVDKTTTVNGHSLDRDVTVDSNDVPYSSENSYKSGSVGRALNTLGTGKADKSTTVNGHPLSDDVVVSASDIEYSDEDTYSSGSLGGRVKELASSSENLGENKVDKTTTVNGYTLDDNIVLDSNDIAYDSEESYDAGTAGATIHGLEEAANDLAENKADKSTTINGHPLGKDVVVGAGDIGFDSEETYTSGSLGEKVSDLNNNKVDKISGKGLSEEDFTSALKAKLEGIESGSQANIIESIFVNGTEQDIVDKAIDLFVPTKTSEIENDSDFVSHADLSNANPAMDGVASSGVSPNFARADHVHPTDSTRAPVESPALSGTPTAPTAAKGTDTSQIATTSFVQTAISDKANASDVYTKAQVDNKLTAVYRLKGTKSAKSRLPSEGNTVGDVWHISEDGTEYFWNGSEWEFFGEIVDLTGYAYDPEYVHTDNNFTDFFKSKMLELGQDDVIATQGYVENAFSERTVNGHSLGEDVVVGAGDIEYDSEEAYSTGSVGKMLSDLDSEKVDKISGKGLSKNDFTDALKAKLDGIEAGSQVNVIEKITINGTRQAVIDKNVSFSVPTKTSEITNDSGFLSQGNLSNDAPISDGVANSGVSGNVSRSDHVHPTDLSRAPVESPTFTGAPKGPTAAKGTNSVQLATTAFVQTAISDKANADDVYTKTQVDNKLTAVYRLKGSKTDVAYLPAEGNETGDVWHINADGSEYFWNGEEWGFLGKIVDLSGYVYDPSYVHSDNNFTDAFRTKLTAIDEGANKTIVDNVLSLNSTNPVENGVIKAALDAKVDKVSGMGLSANDYTDADKLKLDGIQDGANKTIVDSEFSLTSLNPVQNRSVKMALDEKVDKVPGKQLSTNDFTDALKQKLDGIATGSQVNVIESISVNGTALSVVEKAVNIAIPTKTSDLTNDNQFVAVSDFSDLNPNMDGTASAGVSNSISRSDHVHPTDTTRAAVESPTFAGTPKAPTAAKGTDTTQLATTAFVQTAISDKANTADVYTKQQIDSKLTAVYHLKGTKPDTEHLPAEDNEVGDVWHINSDGSEYFWNGTEWEFFGKTVDLSGYAYDVNYVHTDNNFTDAYRAKLVGIEAEANKTIVDSTISSSSANPVENRVIKNALDQKVDKENGKGLSANDYTNEEKSKLAGIAAEANKTIVDSELSDDSTNPVQNKTVKGALDEKVDKVAGKGLSKNDFTDALKSKIEGIETAAQVNIIETVSVNGARQAIIDKNVDITVPTKTSDLTNDSLFVSSSSFSALTPAMDGTAAPGTSNTMARGDHVHPTDSTRAPINSPSFSGTPLAPTAPSGTSTTQIATTAFVQTAVSDKANAADVYTKTQIDDKLTSIYRLKGSKADVNHLPTFNNEVGDVWHIESDGTEYYWNGTDWEFFGKVVDLTGYVYDTSYTHTDNNFTDAYREKLNDLGYDSIIEYNSINDFPRPGDSHNTCVDKSTNIAYRWTGTTYVSISSNLALGTTSDTAYRGDYGDAAYQHGVVNKGSAFIEGLYKITTNAEGHVTVATPVAKSDITALGIPGSDTTYESKAAATGGTDVSLVTTGEKAEWNAKTTTDVSYDSANRKLTKTVDGTTSDIVTAETLVEIVKPKIVSVTMTEAGWTGEGPYSLVLSISGYTVTAKTKADIQPSWSVMSALSESGTAMLYIVNDGGVLTAYACGEKPTSDLSVQVSLFETA